MERPGDDVQVDGRREREEITEEEDKTHEVATSTTVVEFAKLPSARTPTSPPTTGAAAEERAAQVAARRTEGAKRIVYICFVLWCCGVVVVVVVVVVKAVVWFTARPAVRGKVGWGYDKTGGIKKGIRR